MKMRFSNETVQTCQPAKVHEGGGSSLRQGRGKGEKMITNVSNNARSHDISRLPAELLGASGCGSEVVFINIRRMEVCLLAAFQG
jgi:hypothetical protein